MRILRRLAGVRTMVPVCVAAIAVAAGAPAAAAQQAGQRYITVDVARVRAAPAMEAYVVGHLRIGTRVRKARPVAPEDGWTKIVLDADPPLTGYLPGAFLSTEKPRADILLARYKAAMAAGDHDTAGTMAERLAALEPGEDAHLERLKALYAKRGDTARARRVDDQLHGGGVKYIGYCVSGDLEGGRLLATYEPGQSLKSQWAPGEPIWPRLLRLKSQRVTLQRSPWFKLGASPSGEHRELPRALPPRSRLVPRSDTQRFHRRTFIALPGCERTGDVLSSEPMEPIPFEPTDAPRARKMIEDALAGDKLTRKYTAGSMEARLIAGANPLLSSQLRIADPDGKFTDREEALLWQVFDWNTGKVRHRIGGHRRAGGENERFDQYTNVRRVSWFKWRRSKARIAIVEYSVRIEANFDATKQPVGKFRYPGDRIAVIVFEDEARIYSANVTLNWGPVKINEKRR